MTLRISSKEARALGIALPALAGGASAPRRRRKGARPGSSPQEVLTQAALARFPGGVAEYLCIPGRRFRLDLAWPDASPRVAVELDGWQFHGRHKADFHRDREKRNQLAIAGWVVLAFPARDVHQRLDEVLDMIGQALNR